MGVTQWQLRSAENTAAISHDDTSMANAAMQTLNQAQAVKPITSTAQQVTILKSTSESVISSPSSVEATSIIPEKTTIKGLKWLNQGSKNGLVVIIAEQRKKLSPESRELMSKMLKGIQFLPSETGFAISGENVSSEQGFSLEGIRAILVLGNDAGRELVRFSGAKIIPGTEYFTLDKRNVVTTVHPDELLSHPGHKQQAWNDLKQLVHFFNAD